MARYIFLILVASLLLSCQGNYTEGEVLFRSGSYDKAISAFDTHLFLNSTDVKALQLRARAYEELEDFPNALADYRKILKLEPNHAQALAGIGKIHWKKEDYRQAELYFLRAAKIDMDDFDILLLLGRTLLINKNYKAADEFLQFAKELQPKDHRAYYYQGMARSQIGDLLGAAGSFNMCLIYDPENLPAKYNRGLILLNLGEAQWAMEDFDAVLKANPGHVEALARRGLSKQLLGMSEGCQELLTAAKQGSSYAAFHSQNCP